MLKTGLYSRRLLLAGGCCSSLFATLVPAQAFAQNQPAETSSDATQDDSTPTPGNPDVVEPLAEGEIVVTGIRRSLQSSIETKRREQGIVEAVSAEDIGKLPDISIAESIARLPGLAAQRVNGRAQVISLRGLAPDFTTTLLNGRQQASSGDNRGVEFDQYPSELLGSVVIYKTPDANIAGMGLAGTADLRTLRPLSVSKRTIAVNVRGEMNGGRRLNSDVSNFGGRASVSYIDKLTPELGIAVGVAYMNSPSSNRHYKTYNYETFCCGIESGITPASAQTALFPTGQEIFAYSRVNKRLAAIGILEWQPSDSIHSTLDLYYSRFKQRETMRGAQWFSNLWADNATFTNVETEEFGGSAVAVSGTAHNATPQLRNDYNTRDDRLFSAGLNNEFQLTDRLSLNTDLSYSRNKRDESVTETYAGYGCCGTNATSRTFDSISWDISGDGFPTYSEGLNYADANQVALGDRAPWGGWGHDGLNKQPHVKEEVFAADAGVRYEIPGGAFEQLDVGANFTRRDKKKSVDEWDLMLKNGRLQTLVADDVLVNATSLDFAGFGDVLSINIPSALRYFDFTELEDAAHFDKAWQIQEDVVTLKARTQFAFGNLHGNLGVQAVHTKQSSSGQRIDVTSSPIAIAPVEEGDSYWDILPSLNSYYDLGKGHRIRFAASKVMARPRMDEMRANLTPGFGNPCTGGQNCQPGDIINPWSAGGGNPNLKPWRAKALDLSYEWYLGRASYLAVAGFYKKLDTYIYTQVLPYDFSGLPLPSTAVNIPAGVIISPIGTISQPANGRGGTVKGVELSGALEFSRIASFLDGFGALGSISKTKSSLNPNADNAVKTRIPGLSGTVANLTGYYENGGFQARASYRYRSAFKGEVVALFTNRGFTEILADKQVDAQIGYTFPETSPYANLGVQLQVYNLTNSPYRTRIGLDEGGVTTAEGKSFVETYQEYGRQWLFGVNYRF